LYSEEDLQAIFWLCLQSKLQKLLNGSSAGLSHAIALVYRQTRLLVSHTTPWNTPFWCLCTNDHWYV